MQHAKRIAAVRPHQNQRIFPFCDLPPAPRLRRKPTSPRARLTSRITSPRCKPALSAGTAWLNVSDHRALDLLRGLQTGHERLLTNRPGRFPSVVFPCSLLAAFVSAVLVAHGFQGHRERLRSLPSRMTPSLMGRTRLLSGRPPPASPPASLTGCPSSLRDDVSGLQARRAHPRPCSGLLG